MKIPYRAVEATLGASLLAFAGVTVIGMVRACSSAPTAPRECDDPKRAAFVQQFVQRCTSDTESAPPALAEQCEALARDRFCGPTTAHDAGLGDWAPDAADVDLDAVREL